MANSPKECRRQALACVQLAIDSASPKKKEIFAKLATRWISLAEDLEAIEAQLKSKRDAATYEGSPRRRVGTKLFLNYAEGKAVEPSPRL